MGCIRNRCYDIVRLQRHNSPRSALFISNAIPHASPPLGNSWLFASAPHQAVATRAQIVAPVLRSWWRLALAATVLRLTSTRLLRAVSWRLPPCTWRMPPSAGHGRMPPRARRVPARGGRCLGAAGAATSLRSSRHAPASGFAAPY